MTETQNSKRYDLEDRTLRFAQQVISFVNGFSQKLPNIEMSKKLICSAGSIGANYIEANESLSKKDFAHRIRICRKETKESCLWLRLIETNDNQILGKERIDLSNEAVELRKIFTAILNKSISNLEH